MRRVIANMALTATMQLCVLLASLGHGVVLHGAPASAPASAPALVVASSPRAAMSVAPPPSVAKSQAPSSVRVSHSNSTSILSKDIDRNPYNYNDDTLSEKAFEAAEPQFADLDCLKRDSVITVDEAATFGVKNGVPWSEIKPVFEVLDANKDGSISKSEFETNKILHQQFLKDFRTGFKDIDLDGDTMISRKEWMAFCDGWMTPHPTEKVCKGLFDAADIQVPKGQIDRSEFERAGKQCHPKEDGCEQPAKGTLLQAGSRRSPSLADVVQDSGTQTGSRLFALLLHRYLKH